MQDYENFALKFALALMRGEFGAARSLLAKPLRRDLSTRDLEAAFMAMIAHAGAPVRSAEVTSALSHWPAKQPGDIGWVYVAMSGETFSEGVSVAVCAENGALRIRDIAWGRP
jgi:hypothetical protein